MKKFIPIILMFIPIYIYAWGKEGHEIIADIAQKKLNKGVEQQVQKYLGDITFEQASVWMDEVRSDHSYDYMKTWHYVNIDPGSTYVKAPEGDIVSELLIVINELKNYRKMENKEVNKDLKILFHLCGDITQPLHTGYGSDRGGNDVKIKYNNKPVNLHHIWDTDIILSENITIDTCLNDAEKWTHAEKKTNKKIDVMQWMNDSRSYLPAVYNIKDKTITRDYINISKNIIENQLIKGGYRLAAVLNSIFKN
jgi:hypothetical protein